MNFGLSGLNNNSLLKQFYPDDLPEDWRFSYYSNEFQVLLIDESDLGVGEALHEKTESITSSQIIEKLDELEDEIENDICLFFDVSKYSEQIRGELYQFWDKCERNINLVDLSTAKTVVQVDRPKGVECLFLEFTTRNKVPGEENCLLCIVNSGSTKAAGGIAAVDLRKLIEQIALYASAKHPVYVVFSSSSDALENCRNAILLENMM